MSCSKVCRIGVQWFSSLFAIFCISLLLSSCGQSNPAEETDSNGYMCNKCGTKFYTPRKVFAEFCPSCKSYDLAQVVAYVCDKDQHVTLSTKAHGGEVCEKCQAHVAAVMLPKEKDFTAWGATKKTKTDVCRAK
jgi:hypothetical protein